MSFDPPDIETDEDAVTDAILADLADAIDGWEPYEGALDVALAEEMGFQTQQTNLLALTVVSLAVAGFGQTGLGFPGYDGATAWIETQVTLTDAAAASGTTIPAGLTVLGTTVAGAQLAFQLDDDVAVPTGTTGPVGVVFTAVDQGDYANGVPAGDLLVTTVDADIVTVTAIAASTGGADPETLEDYLGRFTGFAATLRPGGVLGEDLAALAKSVPGVHRALGVDLYDPAAPNTPAERTATVFAVDAAGQPVNGAIAGQVQDILEAAREVNFVVHVAPPQYTAVHVTYTATADPEHEPDDLEDAIAAAVLAWLTAWGTDVDDDTTWTPNGVVRYLDLARVVGDVPGVAHLNTLTLNGQTTDLNLAGVAALPARTTGPDPSTCSGTVA